MDEYILDFVCLIPISLLFFYFLTFSLSWIRVLNLTMSLNLRPENCPIKIFMTIKAGINQRLLIMKVDIASRVMINQPMEAITSVLPSTSMEVLKPFLICCLAKKSDSPIMEIIANGCIKDIFGSPRLYLCTIMKKMIKDIIMRQ